MSLQTTFNRQKRCLSAPYKPVALPLLRNRFQLSAYIIVTETPVFFWKLSQHRISSFHTYHTISNHIVPAYSVPTNARQPAIIPGLRWRHNPWWRHHFGVIPWHLRRRRRRDLGPRSSPAIAPRWWYSHKLIARNNGIKVPGWASPSSEALLVVVARATKINSHETVSIIDIEILYTVLILTYWLMYWYCMSIIPLSTRNMNGCDQVWFWDPAGHESIKSLKRIEHFFDILPGTVISASVHIGILPWCVKT